MKLNKHLRQAVLFIVLTALAVPSEAQPADQKQSDLQITISSDKSYCTPGQELTLTEVMRNVSNHPLKIMDESDYLGSDVEISPVNDSPVMWQAGKATHTSLPGRVSGEKHLLQPGQSYKRVISAYLSRDFQLVFQNHKTAVAGYYPGAADTRNLPANFIGCGRIYPLGKPGTYRLKMTYNPFYARWKVPSYADLWSATASSNFIEVNIR